MPCVNDALKGPGIKRGTWKIFLNLDNEMGITSYSDMRLRNRLIVIWPMNVSSKTDVVRNSAVISI